MKLFIFSNGEVTGPFERDSLHKAFASGEIPGDSQVCYEGEDVWHPIAVVLGSDTVLSSAPAAPRTAHDEKYWAFISYSHKDKAIADWLHKKLEGYRIPAPIAGRLGRNGVIPERLFPIFRDREELPTSSNLSQSIQEALSSSRYLIVICSSRSALSHWVDAEITLFAAMGKRDRILALIIDGEPHANHQNLAGVEECFPPALRLVSDPDEADSAVAFEPIASDLRPGGDTPERALLKIVAGLIGVNFDELYQRERRRKRQKSVLAYSLLALGLLLIVGLFFWNSRLQKNQEAVATAMDKMKQEGPYKEIGKLPNDRKQELMRVFESIGIDEFLAHSKKIEVLRFDSHKLEKWSSPLSNEHFQDWDHLEAAAQKICEEFENYARIVDVNRLKDIQATQKELEAKRDLIIKTQKDFPKNLEERLVEEQIADELQEKLNSEQNRLSEARFYIDEYYELIRGDYGFFLDSMFSSISEDWDSKQIREKCSAFIKTKKAEFKKIAPSIEL